MASFESFVSITLTLLVVCDVTAGQNAYNFTCNLSPEQHDRILQQAIDQLQNGDLLIWNLALTVHAWYYDTPELNNNTSDLVRAP